MHTFFNFEFYKQRKKLFSNDDYRPITIFNVVYRIFANVLSNQLEYAMSVLIRTHRTCGLQGISMRTTINTVRTALEFRPYTYDQFTFLMLSTVRASSFCCQTWSKLASAKRCHPLLYKCSIRLIVNGYL